MIRLNNDYNRGAHPAILEALAKTNTESFPGYGKDDCCREAAWLIRQQLIAQPGAMPDQAVSDLSDRSALEKLSADEGWIDPSQAVSSENPAVHFLVGGTQTNLTLIAHGLRPWESVIAADTAHIHVHETGAPEATGHKIEALPAADGKITAAQIAAVAETYRTSPVQEHITQPAMVYLSFPTETGTLYSARELRDIRGVCDKYGLMLFVDGARLAYGLGAPANDLAFADFATLCDAFWIGGTKCGTLFGEALVITNPALNGHFRSSIKQRGAMLAKGWLIGLQFKTMFEGGLYFSIGKQAVAQALRLREAFEQAGIPSDGSSPTNQQFVVLTDEQANRLAKNYVFEDEGCTDDGRPIARFCTSWATTDEEIDTLIADIATLAS